MASKHCYIDELVLVKHYSFHKNKIIVVLGKVIAQYSRREVLVQLLFPEDNVYTIRAKNRTGIPTFESSEHNSFHVLNEERHQK